MRLPGRRWWYAVALTFGLFLLVAFAVGGGVSWFGLGVIVVLAATLSLFSLAFPGSRFFALSLANYTTVYTCIFAFFVESNFQGVSGWALPLGYGLPLAAYYGGALARSGEIQAIISDEHVRRRGQLGQLTRWLVPTFLIGALTFLLPDTAHAPAEYDLAFLAAMAGIALIVLPASRDISIFLIDTGVIFESFFIRMSWLVAPAFAFFTFYSLLVIVFAAIYRSVDLLTAAPQFLLYGEARTIGFLESLYFSVVTMSTVGYGDLVPTSNLIRLLAAVQVVLGVLLLLFGFAEIRQYGVERSERERERERPRR